MATVRSPGAASASGARAGGQEDRRPLSPHSFEEPIAGSTETLRRGWVVSKRTASPLRGGCDGRKGPDLARMFALPTQPITWG
jgi:hypothetical protein